ncbi:MAG TPA: threonine synthase [Actinomycetota bacterium]|nr:threonine synthase [Actinomycetota bacterium]
MTRLSHLECARCNEHHDASVLQQRCTCGGPLVPRYDLGPLDLAEVRKRPPGTWRYRELLPVEGDPVSLGEPETPLLFAPRLSERLGTEIWIKDDGILPGGTFKARGACVALSRARELGVEEIVMPTAGNAGGTWSLYAARAGLRITVVMSDRAPVANQTEVTLAGGELVLVDGTIADAGDRAKELADERGAFYAATFFEPYRIDGKKAAWLEVFDGFGDDTSMRFPATMFIPVGGGVAAWAAAKAVSEVTALGWATGPGPRLIGVQAANAAPIARAFERGDDEVLPWDEDPMTIAAGLRVPRPIEGTEVLSQIRDSGGAVMAVSESDIVRGMRMFAAIEGVYACPEGATTLAAADALEATGELHGPVVLYNTGSGAKYVDAISRFLSSGPR